MASAIIDLENVAAHEAVTCPAESVAQTRTLTKPKMRGLQVAFMRRHICIAFALAGLSGFAYKTLVADVRRQKYADFYRNYDAEKVFNQMRKRRVFQSC